MKQRYHVQYTQKQARTMANLLLEIVGPLAYKKAKAKTKDPENYGFDTTAYHRDDWRQQAAYKGLNAVFKMKKS